VKAKTLTIIIPAYISPSRNKLYSVKHWSQRSKIANEVHEIVASYITSKARSFLKDHKLPVDIKITQYKKSKRLADSDNIEDKLIIDSLKGKVLEDDDVRFVRRVTTEMIIGAEKNELHIKISKIKNLK